MESHKVRFNLRTSKPFSTISYNSDEYLQIKLNDLIRRGVIDFWVYVQHLAEDDETKEHKHLYIVPSKIYDTGQLVEYLQEIDASKPLAKPLGIIMPVSSKFGDWFQYTQHDVAYLMSKGQSRRFGYTLQDYKMSDSDYFNELRHTIDQSKSKAHERLVEAVKNKVSFQDLVMQGAIPFNLIAQYQSAYNFISSALTYRNGKPNHVDPTTGEIVQSA